MTRGEQEHKIPTIPLSLVQYLEQSCSYIPPWEWKLIVAYGRVLRDCLNNKPCVYSLLSSQQKRALEIFDEQHRENQRARSSC